MTAGTVKSFSAKKGYGFIESNEGESYFFHVSRVADSSRNQISIGAIVTFDGVPTPKGMAAEKVAVVGEASELLLDIETDDFIVSKTERCGRDNRVVHKLPAITVEDRSPDAAVDMLKNQARNAGCNAIVNLQRTRRTGHAWTSNYKYSIHVMRAEPALIKRVAHTTDLAAAARNRKAVDEEISKLQEKNTENITVNDASQHMGLIIVMILIAVLVFALFFSNMQKQVGLSQNHSWPSLFTERPEFGGVTVHAGSSILDTGSEGERAMGTQSQGAEQISGQPGAAA